MCSPSLSFGDQLDGARLENLLFGNTDVLHHCFGNVIHRWNLESVASAITVTVTTRAAVTDCVTAPIAAIAAITIA